MNQVDEALRELRCATAAKIRQRAQSNLEDTYTRLVQLEAQGKAYLRVNGKYRQKSVVMWHWSDE